MMPSLVRHACCLFLALLAASPARATTRSAGGEFRAISSREPVIQHQQTRLEIRGPVLDARVFMRIEDPRPGNGAGGDLFLTRIVTGALSAVSGLSVASGLSTAPGKPVPVSDTGHEPVEPTATIFYKNPHAYELWTRGRWSEMSVSYRILGSTTVDTDGLVEVDYALSRLAQRSLEIDFSVQDPRGVDELMVNLPHVILGREPDRVHGRIELTRFRPREDLRLTYRIRRAEGWTRSPFRPDRLSLFPFRIRPDMLLVQVPVRPHETGETVHSPVFMIRQQDPQSLPKVLEIGSLDFAPTDPGAAPIDLEVRRTEMMDLPDLAVSHALLCAATIPALRDPAPRDGERLLRELGVDAVPGVASQDHALSANLGNEDAAAPPALGTEQEPHRPALPLGWDIPDSPRATPRHYDIHFTLLRSTMARTPDRQHAIACHYLQRSLALRIQPGGRDTGPAGPEPRALYLPSTTPGVQVYAALPHRHTDDELDTQLLSGLPQLVTPELVSHLEKKGLLSAPPDLAHGPSPSADVLVYLGTHAPHPTICLEHGSPWTGAPVPESLLRNLGILEPEWLERAATLGRTVHNGTFVFPLDLFGMLVALTFPWLGFLRRMGPTICDLLDGVRTLHKITLICFILPPLQGLAFVTLVASLVMTFVAVGWMIVSPFRPGGPRPWSPMEAFRPGPSARSRAVSLSTNSKTLAFVWIGMLIFGAANFPYFDFISWTPWIIFVAGFAVGLLLGHLRFLASLALADRRPTWIPFGLWPIGGFLLGYTLLTLQDRAMDPPMAVALTAIYTGFQFCYLRWLGAMDVSRFRLPEYRTPPTGGCLHLAAIDPVPGLIVDKVERQAGRCPVCATDISGLQPRRCDHCQAEHHQDCWDYYGGCAIFGCSGSIDNVN